MPRARATLHRKCSRRDDFMLLTDAPSGRDQSVRGLHRWGTETVEARMAPMWALTRAPRTCSLRSAGRSGGRRRGRRRGQRRVLLDEATHARHGLLDVLLARGAQLLVGLLQVGVL